MLDLRRMLVLDSLTRHGSMTRAAQELSFTPSAVSQQVLAMERQVGTALLIRHSRGVRLTRAGRTLADHARALRERLQRAEADVADLVALRSGSLRLATFPSAGSRLVPEAIAGFHRDHPGIALSLDIREPSQGPGLLREGDADVVVVFDHEPGEPLNTGELARYPLVDDVIYVALPAGDPAARDRTVSMADLREMSWIRDSGPDPMCRQLLDRLCSAEGFRPRVAFESDDYLAVGRLVAAGVGAALVPRLAADQMGSGVCLAEVAPATVRRVYALTLEPSPPGAAEMVTRLRESARSVYQAHDHEVS